MSGTTSTYTYDVNASLPNVLTDGTLKYVYGLGLAYTVDGSGNVQVYHTNGLGSVRAITDGSGNVVATYTTDEFGVPMQTQGITNQPFQYTGQQRDAEDGLYVRCSAFATTGGEAHLCQTVIAHFPDHSSHALFLTVIWLATNPWIRTRDPVVLFPMVDVNAHSEHLHVRAQSGDGF